MADYDASLPVRTETDGDIGARIVDSTFANIWDIDSNGVGQVNLNDGTNALVIGASGELTVTQASGSEIQITDGTDTMLVNTDGSILIGDGTELLLINTDGSVSSQITDGTETMLVNTDGSITSQISDGTDTLAVNTDGSINVNIVDAVAGAEVHQYGTQVAAVKDTTYDIVDYIVTAGKTLQIKAVQVASAGKFKARLLTGTDGGETVKAVFFGSTAYGAVEITFPQPIEVIAADSVLLEVTNLDNQATDVYGFVNGNEI